MAGKKKTPKAVEEVKDPTRYVVITLSEYEEQVENARCHVRACTGDDLDKTIKAVSDYGSDPWVVVTRIEKVVQQTVSPGDFKTLVGVPVELKEKK